MRLSAVFVRVAAFVVAGVLAVAGARAAVTVVEDRSRITVQEALIDTGYDWTSVIADGLQVILEGEAPSEATRFRAISVSGGIVDASRVIDNMSVHDVAEIAPPDFAIEILRNDSGVSLIGLIPAATDRDDLKARIADIANGLPVTDLLEVADYPVPDGWRPALTYALRALAQLPRSKISVSDNRVAIDAISDSTAQKAQLESALSREAPDGLRLALTVTAPRPVVTPFTIRFTLTGEDANLSACAADTEEAQGKIVAAAVAAGLTGKANCTLALGVPSVTWGDAAALAITAVKDLGGGSVTLSDADIALVAVEGTDQGLFDRVAGELDNALPDLYALDATLPVKPDAVAADPPTFSATLSPEGQVQLRGRVPDDLMNGTAQSYAQARFGQHNVVMGTRVVDGLPTGWSVRVLAAIEALSQLSNGSVMVDPDMVDVSGNTGNVEASAEITRMLIDKLGQAAEFRVDVTYLAALDPIAALPSPEDCAATIESLTSERKILFDPSSATISADSRQLVDDIAEVLKSCPDLRFDIAGYTDSQGGEEMNQQLSQKRAEAVLDGLRSRRVPVANFSVTGYGEADPIADNDTEAGREANRRIEFKLIVPEPTSDETTTLETVEQNAADTPTGGTGSETVPDIVPDDPNQIVDDGDGSGDQ